jgi:hypothetical protein
MAGIDILDLVEATEVNETTDYLAVVDKSDTSQDVTGSTKRATVRKLLGDKALPSGDFVGTTDTQTITHKTISTSDNTFSGMLDWFYPVGTIYETTSSDLDTVEKVNTHFGGTWEVYGSGRVLVAKSADTEFDTIGKTGGAKTHTLTIAQMPSHSHIIDIGGTAMTRATSNVSTGGDFWPMGLAPSGGGTHNLSNRTEGSGGSHNNLQPYIVVYRYRRTA